MLSQNHANRALTPRSSQARLVPKVFFPRTLRLCGQLCLVLVLLLQAGCRPKAVSPLPTFALMSDDQSIAVIAERNRQIRTVSATCTITLTKPDGQSVALDGILLAAPPDKLRLQATKFNTKLFDLTLNADGLFVRVDDPSRKDKLIPASENAGRFVREWSLFTGGFFEGTGLQVQPGATAQSFRATRTLSDGRQVVCDIDRPTLTPRAYRMTDPAGVQHFQLTIPDYRLVGQLPYPDHMIAVSEQGAIDIQMREVELNTDLTEEAFIPPARAEKLK